jgi:hypothetical protein
VVVALPELRGFDLEGSGDVRIAGAEKDRDVALRIDGSGDIDATLDGGALAAAVEGSGDILWRGKAQVEVSTVSGSGSIRHR